MSYYLQSIEDPVKSVLIIKSIQCTSGDILLDNDIIEYIRKKQEEGLTLIFDEIQTGDLSTGKFWASDHLQLEPDIVVFGKNSKYVDDY